MEKIISFVKKFNLPEYHTKALSHLLVLGKSKAPELASVAGIPRTRIYDILEDLFRMGFVITKPGKPNIYYPINPKDIPKNFIFWKQRKLKEETKELRKLEREARKLILPPTPKTRELLKIVQVGAPSEIETIKIIENAKKEINIISRAFEYYGRIKDSLVSAYKRSVPIKILLLSPKFLDEKDKERQKMIIKWVKKDMPNIEIKISKKKLPIRATLADADSDYRSGSAVFLVEQIDVPLFMREAAITNNPSLVYGLKICFDSLWRT